MTTSLAPATVARKRYAADPRRPHQCVDGTAARELCQRMLAWGYTVHAVADAAGVQETSVRFLVSGEYRTLRRWSAEAILAVTPYPHPRMRAVPAFTVRRRVHALVAIGWSVSHIAREMGVRQQLLDQQVHQRDSVTYASYAAVRDVYDRLCMTAGADEKARRRGQRLGYAPPLAWDDIDHPDDVPSLGVRRSGQVDETAVHRVLRYDRSVTLGNAEKQAVADHAAREGWNRGELAYRTGWTLVAADRALCRARARLRASGAAVVA